MNTLEMIQQKAQALGCRCLCAEPMARHTTFKIGGPADLLISVGNTSQLKKVMQICREHQVPVQILGNGSNMLVSDKGIRGVVIELTGEFTEITLEGTTGIRCGAGASLASACIFAREHNLTGLEFAWGIPGSAGGAAYMNAGAYGGEMKNVLRSCCHMTPDGKLEELSGDELELSYRHSAYSGGENVILFLHMELEKGNHTEIAARMEELMNRRKEKQPYDMPSAGSVFKRPEGYFAGTLIEQCGLKGKSIGGAQVSPKHAGFIVNTGGATCQDVQNLIALIQETVLRETGVSLECEVRTCGEE
ncbi:MAG TPA: UDP-N-acetylmuramate dehydrogenase [Candidatus Gallacutalibacter pullistercoris]|nr:UDP-N-acetylmuramate dehydrogenase [Candidatus Gallacutalibacter pullistercoris]